MRIPQLTAILGLPFVLSGCVTTPAAVVGVLATAVTTVHQACSELSAETKASARQLSKGKTIICEDE